MRSLIIAAGRGSRLSPLSPDLPKTLLPIAGRPIIEHILFQLGRAGVKEAVVITGFGRDAIETRVGNGSRLGVEVTYLHNPEWQKRNGESVLKARPLFSGDESFLLLMSDHLFHSKVVEAVVASHLEPRQTVLAIDRKVSSVFDIDDATKVVVRGHQILSINKELGNYNAVDCGVFKCSPHIFDVLESLASRGDCSLTEACQVLAGEGLMLGEDIGDHFWIDVDTPEAFDHAERNIGRILG